jgi:hypothetical protein
MTRFVVPVVIIVSALFPMESTAQDFSARFAGCYRIELGPWTPALASSAQFHTPPSRFRLLTDSSSAYGRDSWYQVTPAIVHQYSRDRARAAWSVTDSSGFRVLWSDGFTGADLRLFDRGFTRGRIREYFGVVQALSDAIGPIETVPKATVTAWQIECE